MKKLLSIVLTLVFSMALFTGCTKGTDNSDKPSATPQPTPVTTPEQTEDKTEEEDSSLAYETVLAMWRDMNGYWANAEGGYLHFYTDENNKACVLEYDRHDTVLFYANPLTVEATNKTAYVMELDYPEYVSEIVEQSQAKTDTFLIEIAGYADGYVELTDKAGTTAVYVYVGKTLDNLYDSVQTAKEFSK